uniref:Uncharacterized protein n=1 Tax=Cacopsylla melanoneura TaxID=428564 RepID=A0A8D9FJ41_9HEMI
MCITSKTGGPNITKTILYRMNLQINPDLRKQCLQFQPCIILSMIHKSEDISLPTNRSMDWFTTRSKWPWSISESILSSCLKTQNIAYPKGKVPIKQAKLADVKYCLKWVPEEERGFLKSILNWPKA